MFLVVWPIVWPTGVCGVAMVWPFWRQDYPRCAKAPGAVCGRGWGYLTVTFHPFWVACAVSQPCAVAGKLILQPG